MHLVFDAVLSENISEEQISNLLTEIPRKIDMKILFGPFVVRGEVCNPGWTGFVIIDKSHISIHSFEKSKIISIDVYSCQNFNPELVITYLEKKLNVVKINSRFIIREIV